MRDEDRLLTFTVGPYTYEDVNTIADREERDAVVESLVAGVGRLTPEVRCLGHGAPENLFEKTERTEKYYLSEKDALGELGPFPLGVFDAKREIIGGYCLYAINILSETKAGYTVIAHPWPAYSALEGREFAAAALDVVEYLLENPLTNEEGKTLTFQSFSFPLYYKSKEEKGWTEADGRVEAIDTELTLRKSNEVSVVETTMAVDVVGRSINTTQKKLEVVELPSRER